MKTLIAFIMLWIGSETDYNTNIPHPKVLMVSESTLTKMYYGNKEAQDKILSRRDGRRSQLELLVKILA